MPEWMNPTLLIMSGVGVLTVLAAYFLGGWGREKAGKAEGKHEERIENEQKKIAVAHKQIEILNEEKLIAKKDREIRREDAVKDLEDKTKIRKASTKSEKILEHARTKGK